MDDERLSNEDLCHLLNNRVPHLGVPMITESNKETMIALLSFFSDEDTEHSAQRFRL